MPKKYHINTRAAPIGLDYISKFKITRGENCINCGKCTKVCIYEAHRRREDDPRKMADPNTVVCRNCFRCIQECPRGALEKSIDDDYANIGGAFWKPDILLSLWKQAEDGSVPVSGSGYRGPFTGTGFDGMWTDMSEIVRPTRDGIHGREYISTTVELGRKLSHLAFDANGQLISEIPDTMSLPLPILFDTLVGDESSKIREALVKASAEINTGLIMSATQIKPEFEKYSSHIIPHVTIGEIDKYDTVLKKAHIVEIEYVEGLLDNLPSIIRSIKKVNRSIVMVRIPAEEGVEDVVARLAREGVEVVHVVADYCGREMRGPEGNGSRMLKDIIRAVHRRLVDDCIRDEVTVVASGGIAMAEHVPKAMLCGADLTAIDIPLMVALGVRVHENPERLMVFPKGLEAVPSALLVQRLINLMGAWHSQILEMMGAMGIREARRLRGEAGRAIFFEEIDGDTFGRLFKKREEASL